MNTISAPRPKNWLVESILVTVFCCLPFGIVGIINAANVNTKFDTGDIEGAQRASAEAGKWTKIGFWVSIGFFVIYIALMMLGVAGSLLGAAAFN
ncbi:MAG: CD225/dispanin family protein [Flavobacteriales bacterium]